MPNTYIIRLIQLLTNKGYLFTNEFVKDIHKLVKNDIKVFCRDFFKDIIRLSSEYCIGKFELLNLTKEQKENLQDKQLFRYEYRRMSNLRCIFIKEKENNIDRYIFLCAFNENNSKSKGKDSYKCNIDKAIRIYTKYR